MITPFSIEGDTEVRDQNYGKYVVLNCFYKVELSNVINLDDVRVWCRFIGTVECVQRRSRSCSEISHQAVFPLTYL